MDMKIGTLVEFKKWLAYETRLIFTNCGALTWYLRKAWLLDNAPEHMPPAMPGESFEIRRTVKSRLAKSAYYTHVWIRARLAFAERLGPSGRTLHDSVRYPGPNIGPESFRGWSDEEIWNGPDTPHSTLDTRLSFALPGKPR